MFGKYRTHIFLDNLKDLLIFLIEVRQEGWYSVGGGSCSMGGGIVVFHGLLPSVAMLVKPLNTLCPKCSTCCVGCVFACEFWHVLGHNVMGLPII